MTVMMMVVGDGDIDDDDDNDGGDSDGNSIGKDENGEAALIDINIASTSATQW